TLLNPISKNTKFAKQPIAEILPKIGETKALSKPVTSISVSKPQEPKGVNNDKVISPGMFRISPAKVSREAKKVPNTKCLISVNHDECLVNYVNGKKSRGRKHKANVSKSETQQKNQPEIKKLKNVGPRESLATPKPRKPRFLLRWSPTGKMFDSAGKIVALSGCSKHMTGNLKLLINFVWKFMGTVRFGNDHVAAILGFSDLQWRNILITRVYFVEGLGHNLFSSPVIIIRTDNGTKFKNHMLKVYFDSVGISHQMSSVRTPQQNGVVERRNRTLVEAARTMLIFSRAQLFLWAEAIATACFT
nr:putative ribonuclease H-like domain-containing protein [Tanacetum cinerariifolium]